MAKSLSIHVGLHKTGTTYIQRTLAANIDSLNDANFDYPLLSENYDHSYLFYYFKPEKAPPNLSVTDIENKCIKLKNYISKYNGDVILSSEGLQEIDPKLIRNFFSDEEVKIVCVVREQADYLFSAYQQEVKTGSCSASFEGWLCSLGEHIGCFYLYHWLDSWCSEFGRNNLTIMVYNKKKNLLSSFCSAVGLNFSSLVLIEKDLNPRISLAEHYVMRLINSLGFPSHIVNYVMYQYFLNRVPDYKSVLGCDASTTIFIRKSSEYGNKLMFDTFFNGHDTFEYLDFNQELTPTADELTEHLLKMLSYFSQNNFTLVIF